MADVTDGAWAWFIISVALSSERVRGWGGMLGESSGLAADSSIGRREQMERRQRATGGTTVALQRRSACSFHKLSQTRTGGTVTSAQETVASLATSRDNRQPLDSPIGSAFVDVTAAALSITP